jgi:hypothetical protein
VGRSKSKSKAQTFQTVSVSLSLGKDWWRRRQTDHPSNCSLPYPTLPSRMGIMGCSDGLTLLLVMPLAAGQWAIRGVPVHKRAPAAISWERFSPWRYRPGPRLLERVRGASEPGPEGPKGWELREERQGLMSPYWTLDTPGRRTDRALHCAGMGCGYGMGPCGAVTPSPTPSFSVCPSPKAPSSEATTMHSPTPLAPCPSWEPHTVLAVPPQSYAGDGTVLRRPPQAP